MCYVSVTINVALQVFRVVIVSLLRIAKVVTMNVEKAIYTVKRLVSEDQLSLVSLTVL